MDFLYLLNPIIINDKWEMDRGIDKALIKHHIEHVSEIIKRYIYGKKLVLFDLRFSAYCLIAARKLEYISSREYWQQLTKDIWDYEQYFVKLTNCEYISSRFYFFSKEKGKSLVYFKYEDYFFLDTIIKLDRYILTGESIGERPEFYVSLMRYI